MDVLTPIRHQLLYNDVMNDRLLDAARPMSNERLDQPFDMGLGTLGKTLAHVYVAESVWLERWKGVSEVSWIQLASYERPATLAELWPQVRSDRDALLNSLPADRLAAMQVYRDSKGSRFRATLLDMILQGITHSTHHRAQAVNMIRRLGGGTIDLDYMYSRRQPA